MIIIHIHPGHFDTIYCVFTLLDRTPYVDPNSEVELLDAYNSLEKGINSGDFKFTTDDDLSIEAVSGSLENIKYFYAFNPNASVNQIDFFANTTVHVNRTFVETVEEIHEKIQYSDGAKAGAVVWRDGCQGFYSGSLIAFGITYMMKKKMNACPTGGLSFFEILVFVLEINEEKIMKELLLWTIQHDSTT